MPSRSRRPVDRGSAVAEFVLVAPLVLLLALAVVQICLVLYARATLTAAASEGARAGALVGSEPAVGARRARDLAAASLAGADVEMVRADRTWVGGVPVVRVQIVARLPLIGLLGSTGISVEGHATVEGQSVEGESVADQP